MRALSRQLNACNKKGVKVQNFKYRVGFLGCQPRPVLPWDKTNIGLLKDLGFNTIQLNIAWATRPGGEPLNLEDVLDVPDEHKGEAVMQGDQSPERRKRRKRELRERIEVCQDAGLRTIFHFGAPYVGDKNIGDAPPNCLRDGKTVNRCVYLLEEFTKEYPGVDDILIYTYDQHAWLCSEFGPCPRCTGVPLVDRVVPFLETMKNTWLKTHPEGRLWWEPWEFSAGQVFKTVDMFEPKGFGYALHCNIAEVMGSFPGDRWLKNTIALAAERDIPCIVEYWLGGPSEEVEPYMNLSYPLVTLRGLQTLASIPNVSGIKEYYGLLPDKEDPNLRMTGLFFSNPDIEEKAALETLAEPYGDAAEEVVKFWHLTSEFMDLFPWETSWTIRAIGNSNPAHSLSAALLRGVPWHTPSWTSTRRNTYMIVDTVDNPDPWMLEDIQLRCHASAQKMERALEVGDNVLKSIPEELASGFAEGLRELRHMKCRTMAYVYHARETNIATAMRELKRQETSIPNEMWEEMKSLLKDDQANQDQAEPIASAIEMLESDPDKFLENYFELVEDKISKGYLSMTSR